MPQHSGEVIPGDDLLQEAEIVDEAEDVPAEVATLAHPCAPGGCLGLRPGTGAAGRAQEVHIYPGTACHHWSP